MHAPYATSTAKRQIPFDAVRSRGVSILTRPDAIFLGKEPSLPMFTAGKVT
jgi:hypothetical protein